MAGRTQRHPSLRKHALYNSFFARELRTARKRTAMLKRRINELERERERHLDELMAANARVDGLLMLGQEEETVKAELKLLRAQKDALELEISKLRDVLYRLKQNLRNGFKRN